MNCASLTTDDLRAIVELVALMSVSFCFFGLCLFKLVECVVEAVADRFRKRGAAAPFAARAAAFERRAKRWATTFERIAERNRREAARLESQ